MKNRPTITGSDILYGLQQFGELPKLFDLEQLRDVRYSYEHRDVRLAICRAVSDTFKRKEYYIAIDHRNVDNFMKVLTQKVSKKLVDRYIRFQKAERSDYKENEHGKLVPTVFDEYYDCILLTDAEELALLLNNHFFELVQLCTRTRKRQRMAKKKFLNLTDRLAPGMVVKSTFVTNYLRSKMKDTHRADGKDYVPYQLHGDEESMTLFEKGMLLIKEINPHGGSDNPYARTAVITLAESGSNALVHYAGEPPVQVTFDASHVDEIVDARGKSAAKQTTKMPAFVFINSFQYNSEGFFFKDSPERGRTFCGLIEATLKKQTVQNGRAFLLDEVVVEVAKALKAQGVLKVPKSVFGADMAESIRLTSQSQVKRVKEYVKRHAHCFEMRADKAYNICEAKYYNDRD